MRYLLLLALLSGCTPTAWQVTAEGPNGEIFTFVHASRFIWEQSMRAANDTYPDGHRETHFYDGTPESIISKLAEPLKPITGAIVPAVPITPAPK